MRDIMKIWEHVGNHVRHIYTEAFPSLETSDGLFERDTVHHHGVGKWLFFH